MHSTSIVEDILLHLFILPRLVLSLHYQRGNLGKTYEKIGDLMNLLGIFYSSKEEYFGHFLDWRNPKGELVGACLNETFRHNAFSPLQN